MSKKNSLATKRRRHEFDKMRECIAVHMHGFQCMARGMAHCLAGSG